MSERLLQGATPAQLALAIVAACATAALCALSAYAVHPLALPLALLVAAYVVAALARPVVAVSGALLLTPLEFITIPLPTGALSPAEIGFAIAAIGWIGRAILSPAAVEMPGLRDGPIMVLLGCIVAGLAFVESPLPVIRVFVLWTMFFIVYLQVRSLTPGEIRAVLAAFAVAAGALGVVGADTYLASGAPQLYAGGNLTGTRATGTFVDANYYASFLVLAIVPAAALLLSRLSRSWWLAIPIGAAAAGVVFSLSRGGIASLVVGLSVLLFWSRARLVLVVALALLAVATVSGLTPLTDSRQAAVVEQRLGTLNRSLVESDMRPRIWGTALGLAAENPFLGVGTQQFTLAANRRGLYELGLPVENVHNLVLSFAAENGLIGVTAFLAFIAQLLWRSIRSLRISDEVTRPVALGLFGAIVAFLLQGLTQAQLRVNVVAAAFFVLAGMITALADRAAREAAAAESTLGEVP